MNRNLSLGYRLLELILGLNFFLHGAVRLLGNYSGFVQSVLKGFEPTILPAFLVLPAAYLIPVAEAFIGIALISHWRPRTTLFAATGLMALLVSGTCLQQKWDVVGTQMIYVICLYLLGSEMKLQEPQTQPVEA
jgi:thiosulfate dehydrogenase [quinone] large subunit